LIIAVFGVAGFFTGHQLGNANQGLILGLLVGFITNAIELTLRAVKTGYFLGALLGLFCGLLFGHLAVFPFVQFFSGSFDLVRFLAYAVFGYSGLLVGTYRGRSLSIESMVRLFKGQGLDEHIKILDTSVIIDGRIADVCETGFLDGTFIIPQFILQELQHIADSSDSMRRAKGRRGLDMLHRIQKMSHLNVRIVDQDFPKIKEVDAKLVALARYMNAKIITNDFNLNKVAELQGISVLNINELANAVKPVVLPGEMLKVFILKEGKEPNQGVAYLDDGTMVVVENARKLIGKNYDVTVTSVLQTTAGRMIFARPEDENSR